MSHTYHHREQRPNVGRRIAERLQARRQRRAARAALRRIARDYR